MLCLEGEGFSVFEIGSCEGQPTEAYFVVHARAMDSADPSANVGVSGKDYNTSERHTRVKTTSAVRSFET